jgi:hypothetical protein
MSTDDRLDGWSDDPEFETRLREIAAEITLNRLGRDRPELRALVDLHIGFRRCDGENPIRIFKRLTVADRNAAVVGPAQRPPDRVRFR